ncbi:MAG: hypothetical protein RL675_1263 [Bacteroidota bacterium]
MKKSFIIIIVGLFSCLYTAAQTPIFTIAPGTTHVIKSGTVVSMDGLVITPSRDFSLSANSLTRKPTATNATTNTNINNYYAFSATTNAFTGMVRFNYSDAELNGLKEADLKLNIYSPNRWNLQPNTIVNTIDNFTQNNLSAVTMRELTLGYVICAPTSVVATNNFQTICTGTSMATIALSDALNPTGTTYTWTRTNSNSVTGIAASGTGASIAGTLVNNTTAPVSTVFTITANRTNGCSSTTTATITVNPRPSITRQPANTTKAVTQSAIVNATGLVTGYQWQQLSSANGAAWVNLTNSNGKIIGANTSTLTITGVTESMNRFRYRCIVTGQCSPAVISNSATLTIQQPGRTRTTTTSFLVSKLPGAEVNVIPAELKVYPNPTNGQFNLLMSNYAIDKATIRITDARGRVILVLETDILSDAHTVPISIMNAANGSYVVQASQPDRSASTIVVKQ